MKIISQYLKNLQKELATGRATEHTYRPALKKLIESFRDGIEATNEPKREACGAPDYIISKNNIPLGYIEAKDIDKDLSREEKSPQLTRYFDALGNIILTNYLEFRWYENGDLRLTAQIAKESRGKIIKLDDGIEPLEQLLTQFLESKIPILGTPKDLAGRMADVAKIIKDVIIKAYDAEGDTGSFHSKLEAFRKVLIHDLEHDQFADMYAQTICYGLFAARCNHKENKPFTREIAPYDLPKTNPFLREMFAQIAGPGLEDELKWAVEHLAELLNRADISAIMKDFSHRTRREDPVVHFYETFLAEYDPKMREARGVYYTPEPVVSYIVKSVDYILKNDFGLKDGLADTTKIPIYDKDGKQTGETHKVLILDPAVGTGTFLYGVIKHIHDHLTAKGQAGTWSSYVSEHLLPRLFGFELLMAPYAIAHMKLGLLLGELGYDFKADERLRIYLTNTLEEAKDLGQIPMFASLIAKEANAAVKVKIEKPVMVILGNPPYSGHSANKGDWIKQLLRGNDLSTGEKTDNYFEVDGKPLGERNPKWLNDDYVKFIRFAQWRIKRTGYGILGFITNHSYLDSPTFRGMRQSLVNTFDDIYILDLHGNIKKKEKCPDGSKDENIFDIQQGVAIGIYKKQNNKKKKQKILQKDIWGLREIKRNDGLTVGKYLWLSEKNIKNTKWNLLEPRQPSFILTKQNINLLEEYNHYWKITNIMPINVLGFQTHRDHFAVDFSYKTVLNRISDLKNKNLPDSIINEKYSVNDNRDWQLSQSRENLYKKKDWQSDIIQCLYRSFDIRYCYFNNIAMDYPRKELLDNVKGKENICIGIGRQGIAVNDPLWSLVSISKFPIDANIFRRGGINVFPLYLYNKDEAGGLFSNSSDKTSEINRFPNFKKRFLSGFSNKLKLKYTVNNKGDFRNTYGSVDIINYIYPLLHSTTFRLRYDEFLKFDFPRVPLTSNKELFRELCKLGEKLVGLHLMDTFGPDTTSYPIDGDHLVEKVRYTEPGQGSDKGRVWINKTQYFEGITPEVWQFMIGGYQVCDKWLKDRKGRNLTHDDIVHYQHVVSALSETMKIMAEIDSVIESHGGWPLK